MKSLFSKLIIAGLLLFFISPVFAADQSRGIKIGKIKDLSHHSGKDKTLDISLKCIAAAPPVTSQDKKIRNSLGMEFIYIPPGTFMMGSPRNE